MNIAVRRRLAVGVIALSTSVIAGLAVMPDAQAADTMSLAPNTAFNTETKTITITLNSSSGSLGYPPGSTVTFTRQGTTTDSFSADVDPMGDPTQPTVVVNFADTGGTGVGGDGPANPGTYNVHIEDPPGLQSDDCTACFGVLAPPAVTATKVDPGAIAAGGSSDVTVTGSGFSRGVHVDVLQTDGVTPDPAIQANGEPTNDDDLPVTTPTTILRKWTLSASAVPGPRDVQVVNTDGSSAICSRCFIVNGPPLTGVSPLGGSNNPDAGPVRLTFTGTNLSSGVPSLQFVGNPGSATKFDLAIEGTNAAYSGTSVAADFDLRNAAPGNAAYQPTLTQPDGSQNTCSCRFSVDQASSPTVTSLSPNTQKQGTTQTVRVTGTHFSKGVKITVSGTGVTTTGVAFIDPTAVDATFSVAADAAAGPRDVTAATTDPNDAVAAACAGCYTITSNASPNQSVSPSASPCPTPSAASPSATKSATPAATASSTSTASATASSTASATSSPSSDGGGLPTLIAAPLASDTPTPAASTTASASSTASSTASASSSSTPTNSCNPTPLSINVAPKDIVPNQVSSVRVHGAGSRSVELWAYSRPSTTYKLVRSGTTNTAGDISWNVTPGGNTRLYAHYVGGSASSDSPSTVIEVHTSLSLSAYRDGVRKYHFQGTNLPRRAGQLITLYRYATGPNLDQYCVPTAESDTTVKNDGSCHAIITSQAKTGSDNTWRIDRTFTGSGQFYFVVRTSKNINNGRGHSNQRLTVIH